jgi:hypothetical protein
MVFITEQQLDDAVSVLQDDETIHERLVTELSEVQPAVFAFLFTENTDLFTAYEKEYLLFVLLTLWQAIRTGVDIHDMDEIDAEELSIAEEKNWVLLESTEAKRFRDRLDVFFKDNKQTDLLAFVEDMLLDEEDELLTKEGREPMFVLLKSIIDCFEACMEP